MAALLQTAGGNSNQLHNTAVQAKLLNAAYTQTGHSRTTSHKRIGPRPYVRLYFDRIPKRVIHGMCNEVLGLQPARCCKWRGGTLNPKP